MGVEVDVRWLGVKWVGAVAVLVAVLVAACGSETAEPRPSTENLPIVAVAVDDDQRGVRQPQPITEYVIRVSTTDVSVNLPISVRVLIRDRGTIIAREEAPELVWPVSVIFVHEDDDVPSEQSRLEPSQDPFAWSTVVRLPVAGRWRSIIRLLGITQPGPTVEVTLPDFLLPAQAVTLANETDVYYAPGYELGVRTTLEADREVLVIAKVVDDEGQTWFRIGHEEPGYVEEAALGDFDGNVRSEEPGAHALVIGEEVAFRNHPEVEPSSEPLVTRRGTLLRLLAQSPDGQWLTVAERALNLWIPNDPELFAFAVDPATLPIAAFDGTWLVDLRDEAPEPIRFVTRDPGPVAWLASDSALPCAEGRESVVAVEYNDAAWLYSATCSVRPGPASPSVFARARSGVQLVDGGGRVLSEIQLGRWLVRGDRDPFGRSIAWSPDGQALLIHEVYNVEERTEDGHPLKILTAEGGSVSVGAAWEALWTPLGTVVYRTVDGWTEVETDGTPARNYVLEGSDPVSFSPRGDVVARFRDSAWRFFDQDGGELGLSEQRIGDTFGPLQWSPDGRFVALQQAPPRTHLLDLDMGAITTLPGIHVLAWSPDGRLLAAQQLTSDARVRVSEFVVITLEGELVSEPIEVFRLFLFGVRWSPDSQAVTFQTERFGG
ncbi:MAG: hypothetical protein O7A71_05830 [Chloroflexi bacterium]|nr:hypothetical protein [Chloroflexota bacterium]